MVSTATGLPDSAKKNILVLLDDAEAMERITLCEPLAPMVSGRREV
jgi:hypothetical protein